MEHLAKGFMRVVRNDDNPDKITQLIQQARSGQIADEDRQRVLDFPEPDTQQANIAATSSLNKADLIKRAATSPEELTDSELRLLENRYWLNVGLREGEPHREALSELGKISEEYCMATLADLEHVRGPLYEEHEQRAIENTQPELSRRRANGRKRRQQEDMERALPVTHPWVRRLWEEDKGEKHWGYFLYEDPEIHANAERLEYYRSRRDGVLFWARGPSGISCGRKFLSLWSLEGLDYPEDSGFENETLLGKFDILRRHFNSLQDLPPQKGYKGARIRDGLLRNVFLYVDNDSVNSVLSTPGWDDDMWIWAVDPNYDAKSSSSEYKGYLRVRLQQLVHNFFDARRFHADEFSMEDLWKSSLRSRNHTFISMNDDEAALFNSSRDIGSAIKPPALARQFSNR